MSQHLMADAAVATAAAAAAAAVAAHGVPFGQATAALTPVVHTMPAAPFRSSQRRHFLLSVLLPTATVFAAPWLLPASLSPWHSPVWALLIWGVMWFLVGGVGVSVGLHRCFSHRSFEAKPALRAALGVLGNMAAQGPVLYWVSLHRLHHAASDQPGDPHSPKAQAWVAPTDLTPKPSWKAALQGHVGWVLAHDVPKPTRYARELLADPLVRRLNRAYSASVALGFLLPAAAGAALLHSSHGWLAGALFGAYWGGVLRIALGHHIIWAINSWCHLGAQRPHDTADHSANVAPLALLSWGESWHNNHHARPTSARFGQGPLQVDVGWWVVQAFVRLGWARLREVPASAKAA
jgi:stearoyl-CoA desaturase (Delta-9 desaturase)